MTQDVIKTFGIRVRVLREKRQWSLERLAAETGIDAASLGLIERGRRDLRLRTVFKIAEGLGVQVRELFPEQQK
jgi:transcriptional regulator with XRE-family HTH domain